MKKQLLQLASLLAGLLISVTALAQTPGTLTFTFTEIAKTPTYEGDPRHVLAAWIQTSAGVFVKTKLRYAGGNTNDHLPTWASNAGCASSANCLGTACNIVDATTGATRSSWTTYTVTWDGKKGAAATGTLQADGVYKVAIQSTWNHGTSGTATSTYTFTKGPSVDHQTPAANTTFSNVVLHWQPSSVTGIDEINTNPTVEIYPNPTNGIFNVNYSNASHIKVINMLGVVVFDEKTDSMEEGSKTIDLSRYADGIYFINISNQKGELNRKLILNK